MEKFFVFLFIVLEIINCNKNAYEQLLEWGKNNSVYISDKIEMNYINENKKEYKVKEAIKEGEIIISIPKGLLLNIDSALKLSNSKIKKQYETYKNKILSEKTNNKNENENENIRLIRIQQSFLAYLMTTANKNKSPKNKFYEFYKYFFNTFETNLEKYPLFYNSGQLRLLLFSLFGVEIIQVKNMFEEEHKTFEKDIYKKSLDQDEYIKYRIFTFNKFVNITEMSSIIPFADMIETNPFNYNLKLNHTQQNDSISVIATKKIEPKDKLLVAVVQMTNSASFITYGK